MNWKQFFKDAAFYYTAYNVHKIRHGVQDLNDSVQEFAEQNHRNILQLTQVVEENLSAITLELTIHTKLFYQILDTLKNKKKVEAEELKSFGLHAFKNGWYDDAESDFLESIKINRYDYQVYYLLSKVEAQRKNFDSQGDYLKKAYDYAGENLEFKEYILLDVAVLYLQLGDIDLVKSLLENKKFAGEQTFVTCMMRIILDIKLNNVTDETLSNIEKAIDLYESEEPVRIIQAIKALASLLSNEQQEKVERILNKKKLTICKKFGLNTLIRIENLYKILTYILRNDNLIKGVVPDVVIQKIFPYYYKLLDIIGKLELTKKKLQDITIDDYEKLSIMPEYLEHIENRILTYYRSLLSDKQEGTFSEKPFNQTIAPKLNFNVGADDKILVQTQLVTGEYLTLTYFKFLIIQGNDNVITLDLLEDFSHIENDILEEKTLEVDISKIQDIASKILNVLEDKKVSIDKALSSQIKFLLRDNRNGKILTINDSKEYSTEFGSKKMLANMYNLLMSRTLYNIKFLFVLKMFNLSSIQLESLLNFYLDIKANYNDNDVEFLNDEVEFID